ncbi:rhomboid family intramembrane serine protease [Halomarina litorea]|uniref:rhomboid family intramembrane serine protease n=1 Tax=Halomarina litorea TaxID=2961595 RepID=UPI0034A4D07C
MTAVHLAKLDPYHVSYLWYGPWLHSGVDHYRGNVVVLVILGWVTERRIGTVGYAGFAVGALYLSIIIPVLLRYAHPLGASGLTKALTGYLALVLLKDTQSFLRSGKADFEDTAKLVGGLLLSVVVFSSTAQTVGRALGILTAPPGQSISAHAVGLLLGWAWFACLQFGYRTRLLIKTVAVRIRH